LLSGLFLAGANLHGEGADDLGAEDGILTAEEVTAMNLDGTQLVVLSACETGLGEVKSGEGVYGLRRPFQMAGARTVISALWPVSDEVTAEMMSRLYERKDESLPEIIRQLQLETITALRSQNRVDHPFSWAAFIAVGDWR
jgi:CHAT domain-containing protein